MIECLVGLGTRVRRGLGDFLRLLFLLDALWRVRFPLPLRVLLAAAAPGADEFESLWVSATESASLTHVTHVLEQLVTSTLHNKH